MRTALALLALFCLAIGTAKAAGVQPISVPIDNGSTILEGAVWYPCAAPAGIIEFRQVRMPGVKHCAVKGAALPLIVMSHGARGWFAGHHDTAVALADAGYVVATITHPDRDRRRWRTERPAAVQQLINYMLHAWPDRAKLDGARIGFFGFSRGGYTGLVLIGGKPQFWRLLWYCFTSWGNPMCKSPPGKDPQPEEESSDQAERPSRDYVHDPRIKAAVLAAPVGVVFSADGLKEVTVPVQLWRAEKDRLLIYPDHAEAIFEALPTKPDYHVVPNAGHFALLAPCGPVQIAATPAICKDAPGFDRVKFHEEFNAEILAFFQKHLSGS